MKNMKAMDAVSYGLFVLTAQQGGKDNGCIINTVLQVTTEPNRIVFTVNKKHLTHDMVMETGKFTLSILSQAASFELIRRFGFVSGREADKFAGFNAGIRRGDNGVLQVLQGTNAWISGTVLSSLDLGSHTLFLADVDDGDVLSPEASVTYAYYQSNIKPKAPQAQSPAAQATTPSQGGGGVKKRWVCKVCGYVYEGEELPADFICPWCKHPASDFEPLP